MREVARHARYALHTAQPWEDQAGQHGEFMVRGRLEQTSASHPAVTARPGQTPYGLVHYACSIEEAVATEYSADEMPVYRRWKTVEAVLSRHHRGLKGTGHSRHRRPVGLQNRVSGAKDLDMIMPAALWYSWMSCS